MKKVFIDLSNQKFGKLLVLRRTEKPSHINYKNTEAWFLCLCDCGEETIVSSGWLKSGNTKSCGCSKFNDMTGQRFGKILILGRAPKPNTRSDKSRESFWFCQCDCGIKIVMAGGDVRNNTSCGCNKKLSSAEEAKMSAVRQVYRKRYDDGDISIDEFITLSQLPCFYCGALPGNQCKLQGIGRSDIAIKYGQFIYNGLDRIEQNKPHNKENVVPCCATCNWMKTDHSKDEFLEHVTKIYNNMLVKG